MSYRNGLWSGLLFWILLSLAVAKTGTTEESVLEALEDRLV
jgi:hypothetical protein